VTTPNENDDQRRVDNSHSAQARQQQGCEAKEAMTILRSISIVGQGSMAVGVPAMSYPADDPNPNERKRCVD
jgi:hypothetical protein